MLWYLIMHQQMIDYVITCRKVCLRPVAERDPRARGGQIAARGY
jgi:hypothetical protein